MSKESTQPKRHRGAKQERPLTPEQYSMKKVSGVSRLKPSVRGLAPETQVGLSRYSVTIELCDSYCLGIGDYQVVRWRSLCILS